MVTRITAALSTDPVLEVARAMLSKNYNGIPVVDKKHKLLGMITFKELLDNRGFYLPTVIKVLGDLKMIHSKDVPDTEERLQTLKNLKAGDVMNRDMIYLLNNSTLEDAAEAFVMHHEDLLPVVDMDRTLLGVVSKYDILKSLTTHVNPVKIDRGYTSEIEPSEALGELGSKFVVVSKLRARFWYLTFFVFLGLGIIIALALIIRVRIL